jgi:putative flippase GtrA
MRYTSDIDQPGLSSGEASAATGDALPPARADDKRQWFKSRALAAVFSRDVLLSLASSALDVGLFLVCSSMGLQIAAATFWARGFSAVFNFVGCKYLVFRPTSRREIVREILSYAMLALLLVMASAWLVRTLREQTGMALTMCKLVADGGLYGIAFLIKQLAIFQPGQPVTDAAMQAD